MNPHLPNHRARVAPPRSVVIRQDGLPFTHTPPTAAPDRKVTTGPASGAPLPFAAKQPLSQWIGALAITVTAVLLSAVPAFVVTGDLRTVAAVAAVVVVWCVALIVPALGGWSNPISAQRRRDAVGEVMR